MQLLPRQTTSYPSNPGIYKMLDKNENIIYIGKAKNLKKRLTSYFNSSARSSRINLMILEIDKIDITTTATENEALILEQQLINKIKPRYNIIFKDDKSYPFLALSKHEYPKLYITREKKYNSATENLFGPYSNRDDAYKNLEFIQKTFKIRTCSDNDFATRSRPCMLHQIGKCSAPCVNKGDDKFEQEYVGDVNNARSVLKGHVKPLISRLEEEMTINVATLEFEKAAKNRDSIASLKDLTKMQNVYSIRQENMLVFNILRAGAESLTKGEKSYLGYAQILMGVPRKIFHQEISADLLEFSDEELLEKYIETEYINYPDYTIIAPRKLENLFFDYKSNNLGKQEKEWQAIVLRDLELVQKEASRVKEKTDDLSVILNDVFTIPVSSVDCIDISHFSGEATYGGKVRWSRALDGSRAGMDTPFYRLAKFKTGKVDDVAHMNQTVEKIYHLDEDFPDVLIIDGDKPQMESSFKAIKQKNLTKPFILMCSSKGPKRIKGEENFYIHPFCLQWVDAKNLVGDELLLDSFHPLRLFIQRMQDGAHNFSNSAREKFMSKVRFGKKPKPKKTKKTSVKVSKK